jgi:hypothetical protein
MAQLPNPDPANSPRFSPAPSQPWIGWAMVAILAPALLNLILAGSTVAKFATAGSPVVAGIAIVFVTLPRQPAPKIAKILLACLIFAGGTAASFLVASFVGAMGGCCLGRGRGF